MSAKGVAVEGDVSADPGTSLYTGADSGTWTAGAINVETYSHLTLMQTKKVIHKASCTFSFSGTGPTPSKPPITGSEKVELVAQTTLLMGGTTFVLVDGDTKTGTYGNKLTVTSSTSKLKTS